MRSATAQCERPAHKDKFIQTLKLWTVERRARGSLIDVFV